ncbi:hypothetical protein AG0111_0g11771 [Alternaria gaisen]|uniref:Uncharacterized protein n=2 Tax=Alternaria gaisen TaxID=167740 RepID=A0ACB6F6A2_9PLEO|nr:hypothetical protein AG0111_0g11728 [Alternaria gaisen]KAB2100020.1 hypothetical protein AG0111_0g11771 [Alternaria gaisen]
MVTAITVRVASSLTLAAHDRYQAEGGNYIFSSTISADQSRI